MCPWDKRAIVWLNTINDHCSMASQRTCGSVIRRVCAANADCVFAPHYIFNSLFKIGDFGLPHVGTPHQDFGPDYLRRMTRGVQPALDDRLKIRSRCCRPSDHPTIRPRIAIAATSARLDTPSWTPRRTGYFRPDGGARRLILVSGVLRGAFGGSI